jgi:monothiol glutaredoxin
MFRRLARVASRLPSRAVRAQTAQFSAFRVTSAARQPQHVRSFMSDSHSDFEPQRVEVDSDAAVEIIKSDVAENDVFVYMKGTPDAPQCGFSRQVAMILQHLEVPFASRNVLENAQIRESVKSFSDWPTIPQVYVKGEFIGGCDVVTGMFQQGELVDMLKEEGIAHTAPEPPAPKEE